jgi:hypothetical protein
MSTSQIGTADAARRLGEQLRNAKAGAGNLGQLEALKLEFSDYQGAVDTRLHQMEGKQTVTAKETGEQLGVLEKRLGNLERSVETLTARVVSQADQFREFAEGLPERIQTAITSALEVFVNAVTGGETAQVIDDSEGKESIQEEPPAVREELASSSQATSLRHQNFRPRSAALWRLRDRAQTALNEGSTTLAGDEVATLKEFVERTEPLHQMGLACLELNKIRRVFSLSTDDEIRAAWEVSGAGQEKNHNRSDEHLRTLLRGISTFRAIAPDNTIWSVDGIQAAYRGLVLNLYETSMESVGAICKKLPPRQAGHDTGVETPRTTIGSSAAPLPQPVGEEPAVQIPSLISQLEASVTELQQDGSGVSSVDRRQLGRIGEELAAIQQLLQEEESEADRQYILTAIQALQTQVDTIRESRQEVTA